MNTSTDATEALSPLQRAALTIMQLRARLDHLEQERHSPIAIVGLGCRFPGGVEGPEDFWRLLAEGVDAVGEIPPNRWDAAAFYDSNRDAPGKITTRHGCFLNDVEGFDPDFFNLSPREAASLDPQQRLLLEVAWEALEHAGIPGTTLRGSQTGVFVGIGQNDYAQRRLYGSDPARIGTYDGTGNGFCFAAGRIAHVLGLNGPNLAIDTACSSSLVAVHLACQSLRLGECDLALAGGVQLILSPEVTVFLSRAHALAPDGRCKTFDAAADGYGRGEGCGVVVLKRLADALAAGDAIVAVIRGSAVNHNGPGGGLTVPNGGAQQAVLRQALAAARVEPAQVDYIETHGTGTALGDPIEVRSLDAVFREGRPDGDPLLIGAVKTNIGHLEAAAGIAGLIKTALALEKGLIPRSLHCRTPNPAIPWDEARVAVVSRLTPWPERGETRLAGVSSFGISGTNAHAVLEQAPPAPAVPDRGTRPLHLLTLSAKNPRALPEQARRLAEYWRATPALTIEEVCSAANAGRSHHPHRLALLADSRESLQAKLREVATGGSPDSAFRGSSDEAMLLAALFTGQGSHYAGMGLDLYRTQPTFRRVLDECSALLGSRLSPSLRDLLSSPSQAALLDQTAYAQPALFALEYALAELWASWGIEPSALMGHSIGEYVAACRAGVFGLEEGLALVAERGRLMQALPGNGMMAAVAADPQRVTEFIARYGGRVCIAAVNAPRSTVVSGERAAVARLLEEFAYARIKAKPLNTSHAYHSPLLEPMLDAFEDFAAQIRFQPPKHPLVSNLTGEFAGAEIASPSYWRRHARQPVLFARGMETLARHGVRAFLEIGPNPVLLGMGSQAIEASEILWLPSLRANRSDWEQMLTSLALLYTRGADVNWQGFHRDYPCLRVRLPTYPFQRQRYWVDDLPKTQMQSPPAEVQAYRLAWRESTRPASVSEKSGELWLLVGDGGELAESLGQELATRGHVPVFAGFGESFAHTASDRWIVNPNRPGDFERLLQELPAAPRGIVGLWTAQTQSDADAPEEAQRFDCACFVRLTQALLAQPISDARLWLVTRGAMPIEAEETPCLAHACVWGMGKVLALEHPEIWGGLIDLATQPGLGEATELVAEFEAADGEDHVALRGGRRYVERLEAAEGSAAAPPPIRPDATYLVSGGFGALGLQIAEWLAGEGARHLVLIGRREAGPAARTVLERLRSRGVRLLPAHADVAEAADLARVFEAIEASLPPLRGVFHAAGVPGEQQAIDGLDPEASYPVLKPKVAGAWLLHRMTQDLELDLFVCFSSIASAWGSAGQAHYAAANQFLDCLAHYRRSLGLPALTINWGPWEGGGMASQDARDRLAAMGLRGLPAQAAIAAMRDRLGSTDAQIILADVDWSRFKDIYTARRPRHLLEDWPAALGAALPETSAGPAAALAGLNPKERLDWLLELVRREASAVLGLEDATQLDANKGFFRLGLDSLMAVELKDRLAKALRVQLPATLAFDYPTALDLAIHLGETVLGLDLRPTAEKPAGEHEAEPAEEAADTGAETALASRLERLESLLRKA